MVQVATCFASDITPTTATLCAAVTSADVTGTSCSFAWYLDFAGQVDPVPAGQSSSIPVGPAPQLVTCQAAGLTPGTTYQFQLTAKVPAGPTANPDSTFVTTAGPDVTFVTPATQVGTCFAADITADTATVCAVVNSGGVAGSNCQLYWGTDQVTFAWTGQSGLIPVGLAPQLATCQAAGLTPGTTYWVRLAVGPNVGDLTFGPTATFVTAEPPPGPPVVTTGTPTGITANTATLTGTVNPGGLQTNRNFLYGTTTSYTSETGSLDIGAAFTPQPVTGQISGLTPGTTYHVRLGANNSAGRIQGDDVTFTTAAASQPAVTATGVSILPTSATLTGTVNPGGLVTSYHFEYSADLSHWTSVPVPDASIGPGSTPQTVTQGIGGLTPRTDYAVRLVAANAAGTTTSPPALFVTAPV